MLDHSLRKDIGSIVAVILASTVVSMVVVLVLTEQALMKQRQDIIDQKTITASALAGRFQLRIEDATNVMQIAGANDEFSTVANAEMVSEAYKGIPMGIEEGKRAVARDILEHYDSFETVAFVLPNGDIYFVEPYDRQLSLPRLNYADREWYRGAIESGMPYAADVLISTATNHRVIPISVPIHSLDGSLTGIIVGAMDLELLEQQLRKELNLSNNNRVIYVDDDGNAIEDIREDTSGSYTTITSLSHLQSVKNALAGRSGHLIEEIDNIETLTVYHPTFIGGRQWGVLMMQPTSDAYSAIDYLRNQSYVMLIVILSIIGASGYFLVLFRARSSMARQLEKANLELVQKDKLKDEFLKIASHELKTPIQPILGYSTLAVRGQVKNETAWNVVHSEARKLMKLSNNILDISMIQSGVFAYEKQKTSISELIEEAIDSIRTSAEEKGLSLELHIDENSQRIDIDADRSRLNRVFEELLENAVKFTKKGSIRIECKVKLETGELLVEVRDTGTGIPLDILPRLFETFVSKSMKDATVRGAGLGLFLSRAIVTAHGGTITARNNTEGPGVVFEIRLPVHASENDGFATKATAAS